MTALAFFAMLLGSLASAQTATGPSAPAGIPATMDQAIALLTEARLRFQNVQDYEYRLIKRERVNGALLPESLMTMRVRNKPLSIYLRCQSPSADSGLEVCYVAGRNHGMMRVHPANLLGVLGFWSIDPHDPRAFEKNRHCITEAGLGNLLESTARYWDMERRLNKTLVRITDDELGGRACTRIETIHPDRNAASFYGYRCVLWLDKATHLPIGAETYDWPRSGNAEGGDLLESYRYLDLHCNIGLGDEAFSR
ncbi:MAG TPA: DUF1571 domain-containing protein [Gemmataceae bacterium]|jgi:hypothetical protein|nr:DUF1571 domain-containing protein [Gemmataceae bacterium]